MSRRVCTFSPVVRPCAQPSGVSTQPADFCGAPLAGEVAGLGLLCGDTGHLYGRADRGRGPAQREGGAAAAATMSAAADGGEVRIF